MKNRSHIYDINRPRPRHGHKYTNYKMCRNKMIVISIKQQLSNVWSLIHEKVKQHWGWVEKSVAYKKNVAYKKTCYLMTLNIFAKSSNLDIHLGYWSSPRSPYERLL